MSVKRKMGNETAVWKNTGAGALQRGQNKEMVHQKTALNKNIQDNIKVNRQQNGT